MLDFPANTIRQRAWFKCLYEDSRAEGKLPYLKVSDAICLERLRKRRAEQPDRQQFDNEQFFQQVTQYFRNLLRAKALISRCAEPQPCCL